MSTHVSPLVLTACDPEKNVVVEACAGSGKTWLLTGRLFRLLLAGARPEQILAITFTRKAAEEMRQRLFELLRKCAIGNPTELQVLLAERGAPTDPGTMAKARALAGEVLTNPRGVTIDTFHGWFTSLCQMAPLSSGFSRQNEPTEQTAYYARLAIEQCIGLAANQPLGHPSRTALDTLSQLYDQSEIAHLMHKALGNRVAFDLWLRNGGPTHLPDLLGMDASVHWPEALFDQADMQGWADRLAEIAKDLGQGSKSQQDIANRVVDLLADWNKGVLGKAEVFERLCGICLTKAKTPLKYFCAISEANAKKLGTHLDSFAARSTAVCDQLMLGLRKVQDQRDFLGSQCLAELVPSLFEAYARVKSAEGLCDFDDLEYTALHLLLDEQQRSYMLQKLDTRVRHILLDEFQDTNPVQWAILRNWLDEYKPGEQPSLFVVGDPKQSIYRFRRAEARLFAYVRQWLEERFGAVGLASDQTRRCLPAVVDVVNRVFAADQVRGTTPFRPHASAVPQSDWPSSPLLSGLSVYPKVLADDPVGEAERWVQLLQHWRNTGAIQRWSEVMVLVRTHRSTLPLVSAFREAGLPFVLKDKGERYSSIVWLDTMAVLRFLLNPNDNFALLQLLRSPLFSVSSADFQQLHRQQESACVWDAVQALAHDGKVYWKTVHETLALWVKTARELPLFETLSLVASSTHASLQYLKTAQPRYKVMMAEHWDWLKAWALNVNKGRFPDLAMALAEAQRLAEFGASDGEGALTGEDAIAVLTVHSAKGLEATHVILPDADSAPSPGGSSLDILIDWGLGEDAPEAISVCDNKSAQTGGRERSMAVQKQAFEDEEDHLLYVALTRAKQSLHISGTEKRGSKGWYERVLPHADHVFEEWPGADAKPLQAELSLQAEPAIWVRSGFPALPQLDRPVGEVVPRLNSSELRMGTAWHAVLEHLDGLADFESWWAARQQDCEDVLLALAEPELVQVRQAAETVLSASHLHPYLKGAEKAFNELEWVLQSGQLLRADRVVYAQGRWVVLDYKWKVDAFNVQGYTEQVLQYVGLVNQTLASSGKAKPTEAALIDRAGQIHWITSV